MEAGIFRVAVGAVIINEKNQVLLTQRSFDRDHHAGEWEILTGRLNQHESFEAALSREAEEELGIKIEIICPLQTFHFYRGDSKIEHVGITYLTRCLNQTIKIDGVEEIAYEWLDFKSAINRVKDPSIKENLITAQKYL